MKLHGLKTRKMGVLTGVERGLVGCVVGHAGEALDLALLDCLVQPLRVAPLDLLDRNIQEHL